MGTRGATTVGTRVVLLLLVASMKERESTKLRSEQVPPPESK